MITYFPLILLAGLSAFVATPIIGALARRVGFVDHPKPHKIHVKPIPLMGGLAIYIALLVVMLLVDVALRRLGAGLLVRSADLFRRRRSA